MTTTTDAQSVAAVAEPIVLDSPEFAADPATHYAWLRANAPVYRGRMAYLGNQDIWMLSRYADCKQMLTDDRFQRSPGDQGSAILTQLPESVRGTVQPFTASLILMDDPGHRRLRTLVVKPFTPKAIAKIGERVEELANDLLDELEPRGEIDLRSQFALPIPSTVISEMLGIPESDQDQFADGMQAVLAGAGNVQDASWLNSMSSVIDLTRQLIERKRSHPGADIMTGLIAAEDDGDRLDDDELLAMVFTLITAGYETTFNLITNAVVTLLDHPDQLTQLRAEPDNDALWRTAIEEIVRYASPIGGTKPATTVEDVSLHGETIPAGAMVIPLLHSANHDPEAFDDPERFDITRHPNNHIGFGHGVHFCLGANLARLETRVALGVLLRRNPNLRLAVDRSQLSLEPVPFWTRYRELPLHLG